jgi:Family of unknown function (DUF5330)
MFFLLRAAFWLGLVLVLLPSSATKPLSSAQIGASDALSAAGAAISDMRQFCARQPDVCVVGGQAAAAFDQQARTGAKMLYELFNDRTGSTDAARDDKPASQSTLRPADLSPAWRGPALRRDAKQPG